MSTFECDLEGFKKIVAEFCQAAPSCDAASLDNAWKCVGLHYLGLNTQYEYEQPIAVSYLNYAAKAFNSRDTVLSKE